ncbi:hypothetical protein STTU_1003 [Streptomyces sp. Tu6071]|nr:hypothetical protein STTU_1003 [Streptomyces sp. Tu6071]
MALVASRLGAADPTTWVLETVRVMAGLPPGDPAALPSYAE